MVDYAFIEPFKGGRGSGGRTSAQPAQNPPATGEGAAGAAAGAAGGAAGGSMAGSAMGAVFSGGSTAVMSNSGSNNVEKCPLTDTSLYCQISRTTGIVGMIVYIIVILIFLMGFLYFLYNIFFKSGKKK
jgi:hypothetical protein